MLLLFSGFAYSAQTSWLPLHKSNEWTFASTNGTKTVRVENAGGQLRLSNLFGADMRIVQHGSAVYVRDGRRTSPLFLFRRSRNSPWLVRFSSDPCDHYEAQWTSTNAAVVTAAGTFQHCRILSLSRIAEECDSTAPYYLNVYFAPGVGPVQISTDDVPWFLEGVRLRDTVIEPEFDPPSADAAVTLDLWGTAFTNVGYYGSCSGDCSYPVMMPFSLTLSNRFSQPICVGQGVDVQIVDAVGRVMKAWSDEPDFWVDGSQVLMPGEARMWSGGIRLRDRAGSMLSGNFDVWARLSPSLLPTGATDCSASPPVGIPTSLGAQGQISVAIRWSYIGGVIIGGPW
jgi:hypothetical protein